MIKETFGNISVLMGKNNSRVPYSTSLLINQNGRDALIDCGGGLEVFQFLKENYQISDVYLTHYHLDHVWGAYLFKNEANIHINPYDYTKLNDPYELAKSSGMAGSQNPQKLEEWIQNHLLQQNLSLSNRPQWGPIIGTVDSIYQYETSISAGGTEMIMLHTPGHTEGYCCPYFPEHGVLFAGDYDLTSFGPWYNNSDSDIDEFIESAKRTLETDAKYFVTAHHKGWCERKEYEECLARYLHKVFEREDKTKSAVQEGVSPEKIVYLGIFYFLENHQQNPNLLISEAVGIAKHIQRLISQGYPFQDYYQEFLSYYSLKDEAVHYRSEPYHINQ